MNNSQLLYRISNLKYAIRMKQLEYQDALATNEELKKNEHREALLLLKNDLNKATEQLESLESNPPTSPSLPIKRKVPFFSWVFGHSIFSKKL